MNRISPDMFATFGQSMLIFAEPMRSHCRVDVERKSPSRDTFGMQHLRATVSRRSCACLFLSRCGAMCQLVVGLPVGLATKFHQVSKTHIIFNVWFLTACNK